MPQKTPQRSIAVPTGYLAAFHRPNGKAEHVSHFLPVEGKKNPDAALVKTTDGGTVDLRTKPRCLECLMPADRWQGGSFYRTESGRLFLRCQDDPNAGADNS